MLLGRCGQGVFLSCCKIMTGLEAERFAAFFFRELEDFFSLVRSGNLKIILGEVARRFGELHNATIYAL